MRAGVIVHGQSSKCTGHIPLARSFRFIDTSREPDCEFVFPVYRIISYKAGSIVFSLFLTECSTRYTRLCF